MKNMKRYLAKVLKLMFGICICLTLWILNAVLIEAGYESEYSFLNVDGKYMVKDGKLKVSSVSGNHGTAEYDQVKNTLTLTNFESIRSQVIGMQDMSGLKIILKGTNKFECESCGIDADQRGKLTICGGGTLKITSGTKDTWANGIVLVNHSSLEGQTDLMIENCTLNISASAYPILVEDNVDIKSSNILLKRTGIAKENDISDNNGFFNANYPYPGLSAATLQVSKSVVDVTGINYALDVKEKQMLNSDMTVKDEKGANLNLVKIKWPYRQTHFPDSDKFWYVYSKSTNEWIKSFDDAAKHVIIRYEPKEEKPVIPSKPTKPSTPSKPSTPDIGKVTGRYKAGSLYYTGKLASGKLSCTGLANKKASSITIPSTVKIKGYTCKVTSIGKKAFKNCTNLRTVKIGSNVTSIGAESFYNCRRLKSLTLGKNIKTISEKAFYKCTALTRVSIPSKTGTIKKGAFAHCTALRSVKTGNGVTSIGTDAFYNCKRLTALSLGKNITTISDRAFYKCGALTKVTFPAKVKYIKKDAFASCKKLKTVTFQGKSLKSVGNRAFKNTANKAKVTIPKSRYNSYRKVLKGKGLRNPIYRKR